MMYWIFLLMVTCAVYADSTDLANEILEGIMTELSKPEVAQTHFLDSFERYCHFSAKSLQPQSSLEGGLRFFINTARRIPGFQVPLVTRLIQAVEHVTLPYIRPSLRWKYDSLNKVTSSFDLYHQGIQHCLVTGLSMQFDLFKQNPYLVIDQLALELASYYQEGLVIESVRQVIIRLLDLALGKIVWSLQDQEQNWLSVKTIAGLIVGLVNNDIITNIADIDDLLWTLTERYALFLELVGSGLSDHFYTSMLAELHEGNSIFAFINEQNSCMYSKVDRLKSAATKAYQTKYSTRID